MHQHSFQNGVEGKTCSTCKGWYPLTDYGILRNQKDGLSYMCSKCRKAKRERYQAKYPKQSTKFYHEHHADEIAKRKAMRKAHTEQDAIADPKFVKRFFPKVDVRGPDECWEWKAGRFPKGYGQIGYKGAIFGAHRITFLLAGNEIPDGHLVCHECDNPPCCNPRHLFLGTYLDNMQDKVSKNRQWRPIGEKHPSSKLTWEQVRTIRERYANGELQKAIAKDYGLCQQAISNIILNKEWHDPEYKVTRIYRGIK